MSIGKLAEEAGIETGILTQMEQDSLYFLFPKHSLFNIDT